MQSAVPLPLVFAHRGGRKHAPENTVAAFRRAVAAGAGGIETDAFLSRDGAVVLSHDAEVVHRPWRRQLIRDTDLADLPPTVPTLDDLFAVIGPDHHLFIDVKDDAALPGIAETALRRRSTGDLRLWLAHAGYRESDWELVAGWTAALPGARLVDSTSTARMPDGPRAHLARLADSPISVLNLPIREWTPELVELCDRFGLTTMAFRVHTARRARRAVRLGLQALHGDDVDVLVDVVTGSRARGADRRHAA